jgi:hypothetical protein
MGVFGDKWAFFVFFVFFLSQACHCGVRNNLISFYPMLSTDCHAPLLFARNDGDEMVKFLSPALSEGKGDEMGDEMGM